MKALLSTELKAFLKSILSRAAPVPFKETRALLREWATTSTPPGHPMPKLRPLKADAICSLPATQKHLETSRLIGSPQQRGRTPPVPDLAKAIETTSQEWLEERMGRPGGEKINNTGKGLRKRSPKKSTLLEEVRPITKQACPRPFPKSGNGSEDQLSGERGSSLGIQLTKGRRDGRSGGVKGTQSTNRLIRTRGERGSTEDLKGLTNIPETKGTNSRLLNAGHHRGKDEGDPNEWTSPEPGRGEPP